MCVLLFSTNLYTRADVEKVAAELDAIRDIEKWTVDTEDCDKVLRIVAANDVTSQIKTALWQQGYACRTMPYGLTLI